MKSFFTAWPKGTFTFFYLDHIYSFVLMTTEGESVKLLKILTK